MEIVVPKAGLTIEEAEVVAWHRGEGDDVVAGEVLVELAADKVDMEIEAPVDGVLAEIRAPVGTVVPLGGVLGTVEDAVAPPVPVSETTAPRGGGPSADAAASDGGTARQARSSVSPVAGRVAQQLGVDASTIPGTGPRGRVVSADVRRAANGTTAAPLRTSPPLSAYRGAEHPAPAGIVIASPWARRLARERNLPLQAITGSGPGGRIVERDVLAAAASTAPSVQRGVESAWPLLQMSAARRRTAALIAESHRHVAPVTLHRRLAVGPATDLVARLRNEGTQVTFTHVVCHVAARSLREHAALNGVWTDEGLRLPPVINVGIAVDRDGDLLLAVIPGADELSLSELASAASESVSAVRTGSATAAQTRGATFTISNLGMYGVESFTPIVNYPQVAVLGVGAIVDQPVAIGDTIGIRPLCHLSLTFDHRAVDGAPAARFLDALACGLSELP